jgi:hypothetical protein
MKEELLKLSNHAFIPHPSALIPAFRGGGKIRTCDRAIIVRLLCHLSFATVCLAAEFGFEPKYLASKASVLPVGRLRRSFRLRERESNPPLLCL